MSRQLVRLVTNPMEENGTVARRNGNARLRKRCAATGNDNYKQHRWSHLHKAGSQLYHRYWANAMRRRRRGRIGGDGVTIGAWCSSDSVLRKAGGAPHCDRHRKPISTSARPVAGTAQCRIARVCVRRARSRRVYAIIALWGPRYAMGWMHLVFLNVWCKARNFTRKHRHFDNPTEGCQVGRFC